MIAALRRRDRGDAKKRVGRLGARTMTLSRRVDAAANRGLERAYPPLRRVARTAGRVLGAATVLSWRAARPLLRLLFLALALIEAALRALARRAARAATAAAGVLTAERAIGLVIAVAGVLLVVSQFVDYHAVRVGGPGYAGLPGVARAPTVDARTAGAAHAYLLVPVGAIAVVLGLIAGWRRGRAGRRAAGGAILCGAASLAVILLIDLPHGLDVGVQSSRFAAATAVLENGFAAELAAAAGVVLGGLLYYARPCLIRISLSGRDASARRRRRRRRASSRARVARSA